MKKLYLHIGTGKTGSTSIQKYLEKHCELDSSEFSFQYDMTGVDGIGNIGSFAERLNQIESEVVIYSNEWLSNASKPFIKKLYNKLKVFFNVEVIIYLRRQDQFMVSSYQQRSKNPQAKSAEGPIALPMGFESTLNYFKKLNLWVSFFGKENITVRVFDKELLFENDVVADFLNIIGSKKNPAIEAEKLNQSIGFSKTKIGHLLNMSGLKTKKPYLAKLIFDSIENEGKLQPSKADAIEYYEQYKASNIKLNKTLNISNENEGIFKEDFSAYPEKRNDLWDEESANETILSLLKVLTKLNRN